MKILSIWLSPSHHILPLAEELNKLCDGNYRIAFLYPSEPIRIEMKWPEINILKSWIIKLWGEEKEINELKKWNDSADMVLYPNYFRDYPYCRDLLKKRLNNNQLCMSTGDRYFKPSNSFFSGWKEASPTETLRPLRHIVRRYKSLIYAHSINKINFHYLTIGFYSAWDQRRIGMFKDRLWTWGYFTAVPNEIDLNLQQNEFNILWAGRMDAWKNLHILLAACAKLKQKGLKYNLSLIGDGPEKMRLQALTKDMGIQNEIQFYNYVSQDEVRELMQASHVYVLPSTSQEGWGAVLNEAMSEGCAVIGSTGAGASRILIKDGENGLLFPTGDSTALAEKLEFLVRNPEKRERMGRNAAKYMREVWSPAAGAERLVHLTHGLLRREPMPKYTEGPCSRPKIIKDTKNDRGL